MFQMERSLYSFCHEGMPVILMPFLITQYTSEGDMSAVDFHRRGGNGCMPRPVSVGDFPGAPWDSAQSSR